MVHDHRSCTVGVAAEAVLHHCPVFYAWELWSPERIKRDTDMKAPLCKEPICRTGVVGSDSIVWDIIAISNV